MILEVTGRSNIVYGLLGELEIKGQTWMRRGLSMLCTPGLKKKMKETSHIEMFIIHRFEMRLRLQWDWDEVKRGVESWNQRRRKKSIFYAKTDEIDEITAYRKGYELKAESEDSQPKGKDGWNSDICVTAVIFDNA